VSVTSWDGGEFERQWVAEREREKEGREGEREENWCRRGTPVVKKDLPTP
jgi:hypothetical protein